MSVDKLKFYLLTAFNVIAECSRIFQNAHRKFQNVPECIQKACRMFQNACRRFQNVPKCMEIYELACNYISFYAVGVPECMQNVPECMQKVPECTKMHADL